MKPFAITATNKFCVTITNNFGKLAFVVEAPEPNEAVREVMDKLYSGYFTRIETAPIYEPKKD